MQLTYANVMSTVGVFIALGGTSYAVTALPRNSVGSTQIKAKAVTSSDLASNAVTAAKVKDGSLLRKDFALNQLPAGATGATGATGVTGATGLPGQQGPIGPAGFGGAITAKRSDPYPFSVTEGGTVGVTATCPAGTKAVGGGSALDNTSAEGIYLTVSRPFRTVPGADGDKPVDGESFDAWRVTYRNAGGGTGTTAAHAWAVCAQT